MTTTEWPTGRDLTNKSIVVFICLSFLSLSVGTAPLALSSLSALAIWLLSGRCYKDRADWLGQEWLLPVSALCVLPWVAILWTSAPLEQAVKFAERSHYWLFAFVAASALKSERVLKNVLVCFVSGTAVIAIVRFMHFHEIIPKTAYLDKAFSASYITYSLFIVIAVALLAFFFRNISSTFGRLAIIVLIVGLVLALTQLYGRSGYLALVVLSPWLFATMFGRRRLIPVLVAVILTFTLMFTSQRVRERITLIPKEVKLYQLGVSSSYTASDGTRIPSSVGLRMMMWSDALKIFQRYPLFGAGTGAYQPEAQKINPENAWPHPHNSYLYILANHGILGFGLYGWLLMVTLKRAWRARDQLSGHTILAFLIVILIGSLTDTQVLSVATGIALGFITGIPTRKPTECAS